MPSPRNAAIRAAGYQPSAAEVARTLLAGTGTAVVTSADAAAAGTSATIPVLHAETTDGRTIIVAEAESLPSLGAGQSDATHERVDVPVLLQIRSMAPVEDLTVTRAITLNSGSLTTVPAERIADAMHAKCASIRLGEVVGHRAGARLLEFTPTRCELIRGEQVTQVPTDGLYAVSPDPLAHDEAALVMELRDETADAWLPLLHAKGTARGTTGRADVDLTRAVEARPIAVDAYGVTLTCSWFDRPPATMRVPFPEPVASAGEALDAVRLLIAAHQLVA